MKWQYCYLRASVGKVTEVSSGVGIGLSPFVEHIKGMPIGNMLSLFGENEWELVSITGDPKGEEMAYFKCPKIETKK